MATGIANHNRASSALNRCFIETLDRAGIAARCVLSDIHDLKAERACIVDCSFGGGEQKVISPILGIAADRTRSDKTGNFNCNSNALRDFRYRPDIVLMCARGAVRLDLELRIYYLARQALDIGNGSWPSARQAKIEMVDSQCVHQVEDLYLLFDRRIFH